MHYHLIGIGGAGMSAIAWILHERGESVSGSDRQESDTILRLRAVGITVSVGHAADNVRGADLVVYSAAIPPDNPELVEARRRGIEAIERPEMLGRIMEPYRHRIAISGTHGKTTTTSMLGVILDRAHFDASVLIGGEVKLLGGNARLGNGSTIVTEACEAFGSFLHLWPSIAVITNIDADHLDHYGTVEAVEDGFRKFVRQIDMDGCVIGCADDPRTVAVLHGCGRRVIRFGFEESADVRAVDVDVSNPHPTYTLTRNGAALGTVELNVPGEKNVVDSLAAAAAAFELGLSFEDIQAGLAEFNGAGRRFEILYDEGGVMIVDDYAHHPAEVRATLIAARAYSKRVVAVFQPHLYSRTKAFVGDFADALMLADEVIVTSIYAAREKPMDGVSAELIVSEMLKNGCSNVRYAPDMERIAGELIDKIKSGDMVLVIGAGDIVRVGEELACMLRGRNSLG